MKRPRRSGDMGKLSHSQREITCRVCGKAWPSSFEECPDDHIPLADPTYVDGLRAHSFELGPGTLVGEYQVVGRLGAGGMGEVYSAIHPVIAKKAAIKVIAHELSGSPDAVARFAQEARAVNAIGHPNIVDVFSFGMLLDGRSYFVMEWLQGESLAMRLARGRPPIWETAEILDQVCRALVAAHAKGIVHRDLKPDNVFLAAVPGEGTLVKLLDFGIAKLIGEDAPAGRQTRTGAVMGTPLYVSPEQATGRGVDHRTDIYSLGAMAFEVFVGRPPFVAASAMEIVSAHLKEPAPRARKFLATIPKAVDDLVDRMLAKDPNARPTLAEVRAALEPLRVSSASHEPPRAMDLLSASEALADTAIPLIEAATGSVTVPRAGQAAAFFTATTNVTGSQVVAVEPAPGWRPRRLKWLLGAAAVVATVVGVAVATRTRKGEVVQRQGIAPEAAAPQAVVPVQASVVAAPSAVSAPSSPPREPKSSPPVKPARRPAKPQPAEPEEVPVTPTRDAIKNPYGGDGR